MTLQEIFNEGMSAQQQIDALRHKTVNVPSWAEVSKEYYPKKHPVATDTEYNIPKAEPVSVVTYGWQKLAAKRMTQLMFGIPVQRVYKGDDTQAKDAARIMEAIYEKVRINSINLERGVDLNAACECITVWYGVENQNALYDGKQAQYKLRSRTYSPKRGDKLYPLFDDGGDMIALSVEYSVINARQLTETYFDTLTDAQHIRWRIDNGAPVEVLRENVKIGKISGAYISRDMPIWEDGSNLCYEAEWTASRNGNYIRKNSKPTFVICTDGELMMEKEDRSKRSARNIIRLGKGESAGYATWQHANDAIKLQADTLKREFFTQIQLPDMSMDEMKTTPMSGESRKMLFIDAQMKVTSESGIWLEFFDREFNVIREHACLMFPQYADALHKLQVEHIITPYQIKDDAERIGNISNATQAGIMSKRTGVAYLGYVDDVDKELKQIEQEQMAEEFEPSV